eukprot:TRINITY_DN7302_c0_g1_i3.p1 TRINITY_DN7302_c0_g1~~TRINITY_DN7302_c0_g1_i3.p1  ORF type:complete len:427 (+),score=32.95 TRINITY_DN7302_c0_g1_i3:40-1320(+)
MMICVRGFVVSGGPWIVRDGRWLGLGPLVAEQEERRWVHAKKFHLFCLPVFPAYAIHSKFLVDEFLTTGDDQEWCVASLFIATNVFLILSCLSNALGWIQTDMRKERHWTYAFIFLTYGVLPTLTSVRDAISFEVCKRRVMFTLIALLSQLITCHQISLGVASLPFLGHAICAYRWYSAQKSGGPSHDVDARLDFFLGTALPYAVIVAIVLFCVEKIRRTWCLRHGVPVKPTRQRDGLAANVLGLVPAHDSDAWSVHFEDNSSTSSQDAHVEPDIDTQSQYTTPSSTISSFDLDPPRTFPTRQQAKQALLALYVLSRSAWGPCGSEQLPLTIYKRVAVCLGRHHYEYYWRRELEVAAAPRRAETMYHEELAALLDAIFAENPNDAQALLDAIFAENANDAQSVSSYCSSVGSVTQIWKNLLRWFRK